MKTQTRAVKTIDGVDHVECLQMDLLEVTVAALDRGADPKPVVRELMDLLMFRDILSLGLWRPRRDGWGLRDVRLVPRRGRAGKK